MSATNRGTERKASDFYETPPWLTAMFWKEFMNHDLTLENFNFLEPSAGNGKIIQATNKFFNDSGLAKPIWSANEILPECKENLIQLVEDPSKLTMQDYLTLPAPKTKYDLIITNPPFSLAQPFIEKAVKESKLVVMLLRVNFLGSKKRIGFFKEHRPDLYVSPKRPSFIKSQKSSTDATEYAWFLWNSNSLQSKMTRYYMLDFPTKEELEYWGA